ncbi:hypothetical protein [Halobacterium litoreum]|uniref:Uncharacterized protein n=1 Tax=Halobacterium litoreum TaxID=2039234 RepID=A0ABD5NCT4_9EURY|nr:hypothetical protein [Halobacterium litoreum]UHH14391.1 hypothetical protein LT972_05170 [Halobacterium litoreum]
MGTLALDIETASPFREPGPNGDGTECFEWLAVAVGYRESPDADVDSDVLFRDGDWADEHTADLFDRLFAWCDGRSVDRVLTYNGSAFDLEHMGNWAAALVDDGVREETHARLDALAETHVDLAEPALADYRDELRDGQPILPLWKVCELAGVEEEKIWYEDYKFPDGHVTEEFEYGFVRGADVGRVLGERYVDGVAAGIEHTTTHRRLRDLLYDYAVGDVDVLFELYDGFGGERLDAEYGARPTATGQ